MQIKQKFIDKLGEPTSTSKLDEYIEFVTKEGDLDDEIYKEGHHLFPSSLFDIDSIYYLTYAEHIKAHTLLAEAYPIRSFLRPLHFMLSDKRKLDIDFSSKWSSDVKSWWRKFKQTEKYDEWRKNRSTIAKEQMLKGQAKKMSEARYANPEAKEEISRNVRDRWSDEEYKSRVVSSMIEERNTPSGKARMKGVAQKMWDSKSEEDRESFRRKMSEVNKREDKRRQASESMIKKWQEEEYREKMSGRYSGSNSESLKALWADPETRKKFIDARNTPEAIENRRLGSIKRAEKNTGKKRSEETKRKLSESLKKFNENYVKVKCPYCGKEGKAGAMHRWHFENCKHKNNNNETN